MEDNIFLEGKIKCDKDFYKKTIKAQLSTIIIPFSISLIISIFLLVGICISKDYLFLIFPIAIIFFLFIYGFIYYFKLKNYVKESLKDFPEQELIYHFTAEHFYGEAISQSSKSTFDKKYSEIKKVLETKEYIYILVNSMSVTVDKKQLTESQYQILSSLLNRNKIHKQKDFVYYLLICLFVFTLIAPIISIIFIALANASSDIPQFPYLTFKNAYIFAIFLIIPISSIILYFIFRKKYQCKKNLISGILISVVLGAFSLMSTQYHVKNDDTYLLKIEEEMSIDFPDDSLINYVILDKNNNFEMMIKSDGLEDIVESLPFQNDLTSDIKESLGDISASLLLYDKALTYDLVSLQYNVPISTEGYMFAYDEEAKLIDIQSIFKS